MNETNAPFAELDRVQEFWDLIATDAELLRAEFDALIAANWPSDPAPPAPGPRSARPGRWRLAPRVAVPPRLSRPARPGRRQRSPPGGRSAGLMAGKASVVVPWGISHCRQA